MAKTAKDRSRAKTRKAKDRRRRRKSSYSSGSSGCSLDGEVKASAAAFGLRLVYNHYICQCTPLLLYSACCLSRKATALKFTNRVSKLADLLPALIATALSRMVPCLTENSLMKLGGELLEAHPGFVAIALTLWKSILFDSGADDPACSAHSGGMW